MPRNLFCAILGENSPLSVPFDETQIVDELKKLIKKEAAQTLASVDAHNLTLYEVNIDISSDEALKQVTGKVSQNTTYTQEIQDLSTKPKRALTNPAEDLSEYWGEDLPKKTIHVLVELPQGESIDSSIQ